MSTELVPVFSGEIAGRPVQLVNARALHTFLEVVSKFADWIKNRINEYGFVQDQDYVEVFLRNEKNLKGGRPSTDYNLTLDMAKELAMVERNEKGREARRYFIECERRAWSALPNALRQLPETLTPAEQQGLQELVATRVADYGAAKGKVMAEVWSRVHRKFHVAKYEQLTRDQLPAVTTYLLTMELRTPRPAADTPAAPADTATTDPTATPAVQNAINRKAWALAQDAYELCRDGLTRRVADVALTEAQALSAVAEASLSMVLAPRLTQHVETVQILAGTLVDIAVRAHQQITAAVGTRGDLG